MSLEARFWSFHHENPRVYERLTKLARQAKRAGRDRIGVSMLWEVLRWEYAMKTTAGDGFKLNNSYRSRYARLIMLQEKDLDGLFFVRELKTW